MIVDFIAYQTTRKAVSRIRRELDWLKENGLLGEPPATPKPPKPQTVRKPLRKAA